MKSKFINVLMFTVGAIVGSAVTWKIVKDRYERTIEEEIESVKEAFTDMYCDQNAKGDATQGGEEPQYNTKQINWDDLEDLDPSELEDENSEEAENEYQRLVNNYNNKKGGGEEMTEEIRVISPYDFDTIDDYRIVELTYYADGVVEDEDGDVVEDVEELVGPDALDSFGEYEDDAVFVRNDFLKSDIQILKDPRTYEEARSINGPQRVYDE